MKFIKIIKRKKTIRKRKKMSKKKIENETNELCKKINQKQI